MKPEEKYKIYADLQTLDGAAIAQMNSAMSNDWALRGAMMPDAHKGYALPIGAVVETQDMVVPAWVGYDIGCGMSSTITNLTKKDLEGKGDIIRDAILRAVPVGNNRHKESIDPEFELATEAMLSPVGRDAFKQRASLQLGTLGGGNHFIEVGYTDDKDEKIVITIHSGSRGFGHGVAERYMKIAAEENGVTKGNLESHFGMHFDSEMGRNYLNDAIAAQEYALVNRKIMTKLALRAISQALGIKTISEFFINRNHNHVDKQKGNKFIHRKGATHAEKGMWGVIPGNMRDGCFIVKGLGNQDSLQSSSHGAGRVMGRFKAKKVLDFKVFQEQMAGISGVVTEKTIDEAPDAYKNIFEVMDMQKDLVEVVHYVKPLVNVKG